ncbi:MAG: helix-turn-helix domain-containing protein [Candidatus Bathyarchaeota archaeon]|nr:MAG: helix-turn-helix domain-containing protein [Candidatus Bathyarchaeota archaeon]
MTLYEVALKINIPNSFYTDITRRFPSMSIFIWCNRENDVIEVVVRNPEDYALVIKEIQEHPIMGVIEEISDDRRLYLNVHECYCMKQDTIVRHIGELDILNIFPNMIENGWSYHRLIVFKHKDLEELLRRFDNWGWVYKILRKVPFDGFIASSLTLSADALFSGLTERQMTALVTAHRHGYYNLPRDSDIQTIAAKEKVPRTTFQEHLKKAENKLVAALIPHMKLFNHAAPERRQSLRVK